MPNMEKRSHRRISGLATNNEGRLLGFFRTSDFQQFNLKRLPRNWGRRNGRIPADKRYSGGVLDLQSHVAKRNGYQKLPCQTEAKKDAQQCHIYADKEASKAQKAEKRSIAEDIQMPAILGREAPSVNMLQGSDSPGAAFHLEECDSEVPTSSDCSACPSPGLAGRSSEELLSTFYIDTDKDGVEFRKNSHLSAYGNGKLMEENAPNQSDARLDHDGNSLCDLCYHIEETTTDEALHQSDDLLDSLKVLSSDKELLHHLVWGPQTNLMEHAQKLKNTRRSKLLKAAQAKFFEKQNAHKFSTKHKGSDVRKPKGNLTRIVTLRPVLSRIGNLSAAKSSNPSPRSPQGTRSHVRSGRENSALSFQELKGKFKHAIGEMKKVRKCKSNGRDVQDQDHVRLSNKGGKAHDPVTNSVSSENKNGAENQHKKKLEGNNMDIDLDRGTKRNQEKRTVPNLKRETNFQREANTHLSVALHPKVHWKNWQGKPISKAYLWNVLYLEDYDFSPMHGPCRLKKSHVSPRQMRIFPSPYSNGQRNSEKADLAGHTSQRSDCSSNEDVISCASGLSSELPKISSKDEGPTKEVANMEGEMKAEDSDNGCNMSLFESTSTIGETARMCKANEVEETQSPRSDSSMETKLSIPSNPPTNNLLIHEKEFPGVMMGKLEHPSPVSVLIPSFTDDSTSCSSTVSEEWEDGLPLPPRDILYHEYKEEACISPYIERDGKSHIDMEEFNLGYVGSLLDASGLVHIETWGSKQSSDNLLDPSLFDEVETPLGEIPCDLRLQFDCIVEALEGIRGKYFPKNPWASSLVKHSVHPFPCRESLAQEVCGKLTSPSATLLRESMNQVFEKDLNTNLWMDTCEEIDDIGFEFEDEMLNELLEEVVVDISNQVELCM